MKLKLSCNYLRLTALIKKKKIIAQFLLSIFLVLCVGELSSTAYPIANAAKSTFESMNSARIAEAIVDLESKWQDDYEGYFESHFGQGDRTTTQISRKLAEIRRKTGKKSAVIWARSTPESLDLFLITAKNKPIALKIEEADRQSLLKVIGEFRNQITNRSAIAYRPKAYLPSAQQLYKWVIKPIEFNLEREDIDTLLLCIGPDLRSLPIAALHDGEQFLVEKYNLALIPAFRLIDTKYVNLKNAKVLAMGASEFTNQNPLPGVEVELSTIVPRIWQGVSILNQGFTVNNLEAQRQKEDFQIVHLATHAEFKPGSPRESYIQFFDSQLGLDRIKTLDLNRPKVDLLVLSACKTALGDNNAEMGFAGFAIQAGVQSALASLWYVSDTGTVALMSEFYHRLKTAPIRSQALREAQIAMIRGQVRLQEGELRGSRGEVSLPPELAELKEENLSHPYYWSAFTMIGNPW